MLSAPGDIGSFSSLLILSQLMDSILEGSKFIFKSVLQLNGFLLWSFFVSFHCHKNQILCFRSFVLNKNIECFCNEFYVLFITGDHKAKVSLLLDVHSFLIVSVMWQRLFCLDHFEDSVRFHSYYNHDDNEHETFHVCVHECEQT